MTYIHTQKVYIDEISMNKKFKFQIKIIFNEFFFREG